MTKAHAFVAAHSILPNDDQYPAQLQSLLAAHGHTGTEDHPAVDAQIHTFDDGSQAVTRGCLDENDMDSFEALLFDVEEELNEEDDCAEA